MKKTSPVSRSGRFAGGPAAAVAQFTESISFDWRLWRHDIAGSIAHATMLREAGLLTRRELRAIIQGLEAIAKEIEAGKFRWQPELEDVHMNIEAALTRRVPAGAKLHTGRSRNDQVALDMRLWLREQIAALAAGDCGCCSARWWSWASGSRMWSFPATRICNGRSRSIWRITCWPTSRCWSATRQRLQECLARVNVCPLGSGALAGSTLPLDRELVAELLGFVDARGRPQRDAELDGRGERPGFRRRVLRSAALLAVHLSRLAEDLILWSSASSTSSGSPTPTPPARR